MSRFLQFYRNSSNLIQICKNGSFYLSLNRLSPPDKSYFYSYSHGFCTFIPLYSHENDKKTRNTTSTKQLYSKGSTLSNDAIKKLESDVRKGNISAAMEIYKVWNKKTGFHETDFAFLTLVNGLLKLKRIDEAKQIVTDFNNNDSKSRSSKNSESTLCSIFHMLDEFNDMLWFVEHLIFSRERVNRSVLEIIIKNTLYKHKDLDTTLNLFIRIIKQFRMSPLRQVIVCELINRDDTERLEEILKMLSNLHGKDNSYYDMAFAFTICGRTDQAKRIFSSFEMPDFNKIDDFTINLKLRQQIKELHNLLVATENWASKESRAKIYSALLELYVYKNGTNEIVTKLCSAMNEEQITPTGESIQKIVKFMERSDIEIPQLWVPRISNDDESEAKLQMSLKENNIQEANRIFYSFLESETPLQRNKMRFCLKKNAENGYTKIFEDLKSKFDQQTKNQLKFYTYECEAYLKAGKSEEYIKIIRDAEKNGNMNELAASISDGAIDIMESNPNLYEEYKEIAKSCADKGILKPVCLAWTYNFVNNTNTLDNDVLWNKYLKSHPTIVCNQVSKILFKRKETDKLRIFLNLKNLNKKVILKSELGKAYSNLFDSLFFKGDYDLIIEELEKAIKFVSLKDFKSNTLNRMKFSSDELRQRFWSIINRK